MRKLFSLLSLLVLASMILAACGGAAPATQPPAPQTEEPAATQPPAATEEPSATEAPMTGEFKSKDPTTYVEATIGEPETLDPALAYETAGGEIIQNVYETLVFYDGEATDKFVPMLAESWEVSDDGTVYTFHIRQGVKFHEGQDMTATDVAYSFQRGLLYGGYSGPQWLLAEPFFGVGVDDVSLLVDDTGALADDQAGLAAADPAALKAACEKVTGAIVADDSAGTVTMTLAQAWGPFIPTIAQGWGSIMNKEWTVANGGWDGSCDTWQNFYAVPSESNPLTAIMNGTGAFKLDHWTQGEELVLVRNDDYWREPAKLERVIIKSIDEWGTRFAMLQAGDADVVNVPPENRSQVDEMVGSIRVFDLDSNSYGEEQEVCAYDPSQAGVAKFTPCAAGETGTGGPLRLYIGRPSLSSQDLFLTFNVADTSNYVGSGQLDGNGIPLDFFSDIHVRKGFAYSFDWDIYITDVFDGEAVQQPVLARQGMPGYDPDAPVYTLDLDKAAEEFKLADVDKDGIPAGDDPEGDIWTVGFRLQALYNQGNTSRQVVCEILAANLATVNELFSVETVGLPWPTFLRTLRASEAPFFASGWAEDIHDPHNWYQPYMVGTYANRQLLPEDLLAQFRDILNRGVAETDPEARQTIYEEANALYYEQVPTVLLATATSHGFEARYLHGQVLNPIFSGSYFYPMSKD
jgi:peptide/nickel transport system substrate-binding protein